MEEYVLLAKAEARAIAARAEAMAAAKGALEDWQKLDYKDLLRELELRDGHQDHSHSEVVEYAKSKYGSTSTAEAVSYTHLTLPTKRIV